MGQSDAGHEGGDEAAIRALFSIAPDALLGAGGEARVFAVDDATVLRILHPSPRPPRETANALLDWWDAEPGRGDDLGLVLPTVFDAGRIGHQSWTLERRIPGRSVLSHLRDTPDEAARRHTLVSMLDAANRLRRLPLPPDLSGFCRLVEQPTRRLRCLPDLIDDRIRVGLADNGPELARRVPDLQQRRTELVRQLRTRQVQPGFVHNDYFAGNVLCDAQGIVTGVCDIGAHALAADPVMDEVATVALLDSYPGAAADAAWLAEVLRERLGPDAWLADAYTQFYAMYYAMDSALLDWSVRLLGGH